MRAGWKKHGFYWVRPGFHDVVKHRKEAREIFYNHIVIRAIKTMLRAQGIQMSVAGSENLPTIGGALLAINHTGYFDFIFGGTTANLHGRRLVRFMAKKEVFDIFFIGALMRKMKHIPVDRAAGASSLDAAIASLKAGNLVGIFPEATISRSFEIKEIKTGAARIAHEADVPLIPVICWGSQRIWTKGHKKHLGRNKFPIWVQVGEPIPLTGTAETDTQTLRTTMITMLDKLRTEYETEYGPFPGGEYWRPASLGGGAPKG